MMHRVLIEFAVDVPNPGVARDVETRLTREHLGRVCETLKAVTGYDPQYAPGKTGLTVGIEPVTWNEAAQEWIGPDDDELEDA
jgi:hypothetical protein